jgi:hypothetical protein
VDALCINQQDEVEKRTQIGLMSTIYRQAKHVWAWLGVAQHQDQMPIVLGLIPRVIEAADYLHKNPEADPDPAKLLQAARDASTGVPIASIISKKRWDHIHNVLRRFGLQALEPSIWATVLHILRNEWFLRLWIVQEAALARSTSFLLGDHEIAYELLEQFTKAADTLRFTYDAQGACVDLAIGPSRTAVFALRKTVQTGIQSDDWTAALLFQASYHVSATQTCSRPEDRIFGILGLIEPRWAHALGIDALLESASIPELYAKFTALLLTRLPTYFTTWWLWQSSAFKNKSKRRHGLPSWVPDFHHLWREEADVRYESGRIIPRQASTRKGSWVRQGTSLEQLIFSGIIFDEVLTVFPGVPESFKSMVRWEADIASSWLNELVAKFNGDGEKIHALLDIYWGTLFGNVENPKVDENFMRRIKPNGPPAEQLRAWSKRGLASNMGMHKTAEHLCRVLQYAHQAQED